MKAQIISLTMTAAAVVIGSGCASDPYAEHTSRNRGAVGGAAAGAVLGGVIGNNSGRVSTEEGAAIGAAAGGLAGAAIGHQRDQQRREAARTSTDTAAASTSSPGYTVQTVPSTPVSEPQENIPQQPSANAVWIRGHYVWTGDGYTWQPGRWEVPPAGTRTWVQPSWQPAANGGYVYVQGHWQ